MREKEGRRGIKNDQICLHMEVVERGVVEGLKYFECRA